MREAYKPDSVLKD